MLRTKGPSSSSSSGGAGPQTPQETNRRLQLARLRRAQERKARRPNLAALKSVLSSLSGMQLQEAGMLLGANLSEVPKSADGLVEWLQNRGLLESYGLGAVVPALEHLHCDVAVSELRAANGEPLQQGPALDPWALLKLELARRVGPPPSRQNFLRLFYDKLTQNDVAPMRDMKPLEVIEALEVKGVIGPHNLAELVQRFSGEVMSGTIQAAAPGVTASQAQKGGDLKQRLATLVRAEDLFKVAMLLGAGIGERPTTVEQLFAWMEQRQLGHQALHTVLLHLGLAPAAQVVAEELAGDPEAKGKESFTVDRWGLLKLELARLSPEALHDLILRVFHDRLTVSVLKPIETLPPLEQIEALEARGLIGPNNLDLIIERSGDRVGEACKQAKPGLDQRPADPPVDSTAALKERLSSCVQVKEVPKLAMLMGAGLGERPTSMAALFEWMESRGLGLEALRPSLEKLGLQPAVQALQELSHAQPEQDEKAFQLDSWACFKLKLVDSIGPNILGSDFLKKGFFDVLKGSDLQSMRGLDTLQVLELLESKGLIGPGNLTRLTVNLSGYVWSQMKPEK